MLYLSKLKESQLPRIQSSDAVARFVNECAYKFDILMNNIQNF